VEDRLIVATVWGIPIRLHFRWFLVFGLVTWSLAGGYFPVEYPGWARSARPNASTGPGTLRRNTPGASPPATASRVAWLTATSNAGCSR